jgi:hypothetical protein
MKDSKRTAYFGGVSVAGMSFLIFGMVGQVGEKSEASVFTWGDLATVVGMILVISVMAVCIYNWWTDK